MNSPSSLTVRSVSSSSSESSEPLSSSFFSSMSASFLRLSASMTSSRFSRGVLEFAKAETAHVSPLSRPFSETCLHSERKACHAMICSSQVWQIIVENNTIFVHGGNLFCFCFAASRVSLAGAATSIIFVTTKHVFCRYKSMLVATKVCFSRQNYCRDKIMFLSRQMFCRDKHTFVATKDVFCRD